MQTPSELIETLPWRWRMVCKACKVLWYVSGGKGGQQGFDQAIQARFKKSWS